MNQKNRLLKRVLVVVAHVLSVPVYFGYELFVRLINRKGEAIPSDIRARIEPYVSDIDLDRVELRMDARVPSGHAGLTLGWRMFINRRLEAQNNDDMRLLIHELVHVRQCQTFGRTGMMRKYGVEWARVLSYSDHPLEIEARAYEKWALDLLVSEPDQQ